MNYSIDQDEVILYEGKVGYLKESQNVDFVLTSKKMIFEKTKGIFKKEKKLVDLIELDKIKKYNDTICVKQKSNEINVQTIDKNLSLYFSGMIEAKKVFTKIIDTTTGTTMTKRGTEKVKNALDIVDETLGLDTRGIVRGVLENGVKGTIINGIKKRK